MVRTTRVLVAFLAGLVPVVATGCGSSQTNKAGGVSVKPLVLTLADGENDVSNAQPFANAVRKLSHGTLAIDIKSPWRPNDPRYETALIKDVQAGKAQMGITASRGFDTVGIDTFEALQAPFLIDNLALERRVLASPLARRMLGELAPSKLVGLAILPGPLRRIMSLTGPLTSASDFRGRTIGIRASTVTADALRALGARPVVIPRDNDTAGLTGIESHLNNLDTTFPERGATITGNINFEPRPNVIFMNQRAFDALSAAQRHVLTLAAAQTERTASIYEPDTGAVDDLCRRGIKIVTASSAELAGLRRAVQPVYAALESTPATRAYIDQIAALRRSTGGSPDAVTCSAAAEPSTITAGVTRLDGTWGVGYTRAQFFAAGADPSENVPGNWGQFTLTFDRGHWSEVFPDLGPGDGPASGTYVVTGDEITFHRTDHAYTGSDTEIWGPYTWSVYRDTLTFREGQNFDQGPTGLIVKPWRRSSSGH
jgi:TRAP-type C4-dicarboxylate transport system substrate-binding protein